MDLIVTKVVHDPAPYSAELENIPVPEDLCAEYDQPDREAVIAARVSRFNQGRDVWSRRNGSGRQGNVAYKIESMRDIIVISQSKNKEYMTTLFVQSPIVSLTLTCQIERIE